MALLHILVLQEYVDAIKTCYMVSDSDAPIIGQISDIGLISTKIRLSVSVKI